jgi:outer membrane protein OmpA-like peptidoglycan-associated protein
MHNRLLRLGRNFVVLAILYSLSACATAPVQKEPEPLSPEEQLRKEQEVRILKLEAKARQLEETTEVLADVRGRHDEVRRRLTAICVDYPEHRVCQPQTAAQYAREAFCADTSFTQHVDEVVAACHQGQCKQVDDAQLLKRTQYMTLLTRLPHALVTFGANKTKLDRSDRRQIQHFIEQIGAEGGYVIIVGRASRDGTWRNNLKLALGRAESTRQFVVDTLGFDQRRVGYITYGHEKMYLTELDAERLANKKLSLRRANRSALLFAYPCYDTDKKAETK